MAISNEPQNAPGSSEIGGGQCPAAGRSPLGAPEALDRMHTLMGRIPLFGVVPHLTSSPSFELPADIPYSQCQHCPRIALARLYLMRRQRM
jgi:hypothetical protein